MEEDGGRQLADNIAYRKGVVDLMNVILRRQGGEAFMMDRATGEARKHRGMAGTGIMGISLGEICKMLNIDRPLGMMDIARYPAVKFNPKRPGLFKRELDLILTKSTCQSIGAVRRKKNRKASRRVEDGVFQTGYHNASGVVVYAYITPELVVYGTSARRNDDVDRPFDDEVAAAIARSRMGKAWHKANMKLNLSVKVHRICSYYGEFDGMACNRNASIRLMQACGLGRWGVMSTDDFDDCRTTIADAQKLSHAEALKAVMPLTGCGQADCDNSDLLSEPDAEVFPEDDNEIGGQFIIDIEADDDQ